MKKGLKQVICLLRSRLFYASYHPFLGLYLSGIFIIYLIHIIEDLYGKRYGLKMIAIISANIEKIRRDYLHLVAKWGCLLEKNHGLNLDAGL